MDNVKVVRDWDAIEREFRAGIKTLREIGAEFGLSHAAVKQRADKFGWVRNLDAKIKAKTDELVSKKTLPTQLDKITEAELIQSKAEQQAEVLLVERADIKRLAGMCEKFEIELDKHEADLEKKARIMKSLTETRKIIIELRRRNYNINDNANGDADRSTHNKELTVNFVGANRPA